MSGKHVHFAPDAYPGTPSPSFSVSSLPSSTGPFTPPTHYQSLVPTLPAGSIQVHPFLRLSPVPMVDYDISLRAETARPRDHRISAAQWQHILTQPATEPALPYMEIRSPSLPWCIAIYPSSKGSLVVTVADVLYGIYASLRTGVTRDEYALNPQLQPYVDAAYRHRCKNLADPVAIDTESKKGVKRIDFCLENNSFVGLSSTKQGGHVWQMALSR
ncbi:hypothetical protein FA15DRAFT_670155 [Coprinopsis marcescibilis]|uniref:DUF6699 domain-containing protein n=1 Tax=Coprinopsis marcescibilis TaxID=230819 RepID=A0A5C3KTD5_COPMA|nr:hypothetical protein FA15DRAFT_670155 [Coprinopsis marcescibilis]